MGAPPVSVVVPTYNRRESLAAALDSVRAQAWPDLEIIVVDDGSTDGTADADLGGDVTLLVQENRGPSAARNRGIREARGEIVALLDSDDRWAEGKLAAQVPLLAGDPGAVLSYAREEARDPEGRRLHVRPSRLPTGDVLAALVRGNFVPTSTVLARREAVLDAGGFDEEMTHSEDWDLWLRLAERGAFRPADAILSTYAMHPDQLIQDRLALSRGRLRVLEKALERYGPRGRLARIVEKRLADRLLRLGKRLLRSGRRPEAIRLLSRARKHAPFAGLKASWILFRDSRDRAAP